MKIISENIDELFGCVIGGAVVALIFKQSFLSMSIGAILGFCICLWSIAEDKKDKIDEK